MDHFQTYTSVSFTTYALNYGNVGNRKCNKLTEPLRILEISSKQLLVLNHFPTRELQIMVGPERHKRHYFTERKKLNLKIALRLWEEIKSLSNTATKMYIVDLLMHVRTGCPVMARFSFLHLHPCKGPERALLAPSSRKWHVNTTILAILPIRKCKSTHWYECTAIFTDYWYIYIYTGRSHGSNKFKHADRVKVTCWNSKWSSEWGKGDLSDFERDMVLGARCCGTAFWSLERWSEKRKYPEKGSRLGKNALLSEVRGE